MKKFYLLFIASFGFLSGVSAQSAIDPVTGGDFDEGSTFAANGWNVVNSSANEWVVGTGASATPPSSPNTAYISTDGNPANYSYDNTTAHISHFYQVVTLPANAINVALTFQLKGNYEDDTTGNLVDGLEVYTNDATALPVADALPGGPNVIQQFVQTSDNIDYIGQTRNLNYYAGKTFLVIFTWINNGDDVGDGPPASVDQASLTYCIKGAKYNVTGGGAFCTGSSGVGIGLSSSDTAISYQLYNNGNPVGNPVNGTGVALNFGLQTVVGSYTVIGTSGCHIDYPMNGSAAVTENPLPTASAASNGPLCLGATLNLTSTGGLSYNWTGPNGFISAVQNPSISNFSAANAGTYTVNVKDNNGCTAPANIDVAITAGTAKGGILSSLSICDGGGGMLNLSGNTNNPDHWEYTTDSASATWTSIANTSTTLNFSGITLPTFYRAVINDGCSNVYSDTASVSIHNYWIGATSPDWNTAANWSDDHVPNTASCADVYIPGGAPNQPLLSGAPTASITNLHISTGAILTVNNTGLLQIAGTISNTGEFDLTHGTLELNGTSGTQNIDGSLFKDNTIMKLIISNNLNVANTANDTLNITGTLSFGKPTAQLQTGNNITLKSSATATANVGILASGDAINGNITVERYTDVGVGHGASWQFVATPTQGQTVFQTWMENGTTPIGYGTNITDPSGSANGFDAVSYTPSLKYYDPSSSGWIGIGNPKTTQVYNKEGYILFVRGDRSVLYPATGNTTLRTEGHLFTPANPPPTTTVLSASLASVGNPYASAIDMNSIGLSGDVGRIYTVWDPTLGGLHGVGGYRTLAQTGPTGDHNFYATPLAASGIYSGSLNNIESGQAFFVQSSGTSGGGTVFFNESMKASVGSHLVFRQDDASGITRGRTQLRANLYSIADTPVLADGNLIQYDPMYSDELDKLDARKVFNSGENFGIISGGKNLVIERRTDIQKTDTIFYDLTGLKAQSYKIVFTANSLSAYGLQGFVEDTYLNTRTLLNMEDSTEVDFAVNSAAASYAPGRFRIVFALPPPTIIWLTFISLSAYQEDTDIRVLWNVRNEKGMGQYQVEKSMDGVNFTKVATVNVLNDGIGAYQWTDKQVTPGDNYYRIRCIGLDGRISYSTVVKVPVVFENPSISVYPNPITDGMIHLHFINQPQGRYKIRLLNSLGQLTVASQIELAGGGNATENIHWNYKTAHGIYQLEITRPDGSLEVINVLY